MCPVSHSGCTARSLGRDRRGGGALEFAVVALPFITFLLFLLELGYDFFAQVALDYGVQTAARQIQIGNAQGASTAAIFQANYLCPAVNGLLPCSAITVNITPITSDYYTAVPAKPADQCHRPIKYHRLHILPRTAEPTDAGAGTIHVAQPRCRCRSRDGDKCGGRLRSGYPIIDGIHQWKIFPSLPRRPRDAEAVTCRSCRMARPAAAGLAGAAFRLLRETGGSPAIEFAIVAPVMITLLTGTYDITQILIAQRKVVVAAQEIVEIATELSVQPDQSISLTTTQAYQAQTAIYGVMPALKSGADTSQFFVTLSAAVFTATPAGCVAGVNCTYEANTAWSIPLPQSTAAVSRPCGVIAQVFSTQQATIQNLPTAGMTALTSVVIADVSYNYQPLFIGFVTGPITLHRTAVVPPRTGSAAQYVQYDLANATGNPAICPGFL